MTPLERQRDYINLLLTDRIIAKEVRVFGLMKFLTARFDELSDQHVKERRKVARRRLRRQLVVGVESMLLMGGTVGLIAWLYASGQMSLAAAGAAMYAILMFSGSLASIGAGTGGLYESSLFLDDYKSFMGREGAKRSAPALPSPGVFEDLAMEHVTFTYPGSPAPAIADVSLRIKAGQVVALVGENGSGKTTLAKMVAGLYRPDSGHIYWDGIDTDSYDMDDLRRHITAVFQDFTRYSLTARENIAIGRHERIEDMPAVEDAARLAGIDDVLGHLPDGFETMLGPAFSAARTCRAGNGSG